MRLHWLGKSINVVVLAAACIPAVIFLWLHVKGEEQQKQTSALSLLERDLATIISLTKFEPIRTIVANAQLPPRNGGIYPFVSPNSPNIGSNDAPYNATAERFPLACFTIFKGSTDPLAICGILATRRDEPHLKLGVAFCETDINGWPQPTNESSKQYLPVTAIRSKVDHFKISLNDGDGFSHAVIASIGHLRTLPGNTNARAINAHEMIAPENGEPILEASPRWRTAWLSNDLAHGILQCTNGEPHFLSAMVDLRCLWYEKQGRVDPRASESDCGRAREDDGATDYVRSGVLSDPFRKQDDAFFTWARSLEINAVQYSSDGDTAVERTSTLAAKGARNDLLLIHAFGSYLKDNYRLHISGAHRVNWESAPPKPNANPLDAVTTDVSISDLIALDETHRSLFNQENRLRFSLGMQSAPAPRESFFGPGSPILFGVLLVLAILLAIFNYSVVLPVRRLSAAIDHPIPDIKGVPYTNDQFEVGVLARALAKLIRDVTERDAAIEERNADLSKLATLVEQRNSELKLNAQRIAGLEGILDGIAHDIKTPVHEIAAGLRTHASTRNLSADEVLLDARIRKIIERIDVIERLSIGRRASANLTPFDVNEWLPTVPSSFDDTEAIQSGTPCVALAKGELIEMIVENLWKNARRFKNNGTMIRIGGVRHVDHVIIFVENDGPRIAEDRQALLFRRGYTSGGGRANRGLGLALASEYAVMLGGELRFVDVPNGARFELWLRAAY